MLKHCKNVVKTLLKRCENVNWSFGAGLSVCYIFIEHHYFCHLYYIKLENELRHFSFWVIVIAHTSLDSPCCISVLTVTRKESDGKLAHWAEHAGTFQDWCHLAKSKIKTRHTNDFISPYTLRQMDAGTYKQHLRMFWCVFEMALEVMLFPDPFKRRAPDGIIAATYGSNLMI